MTPEQKKLLKPYANVLCEWDQVIMNMGDAELTALQKACEAVSTTNCWACTYHAANTILPAIERALYFRRQQKKPAA